MKQALAHPTQSCYGMETTVSSISLATCIVHHRQSKQNNIVELSALGSFLHACVFLD